MRNFLLLAVALVCAVSFASSCNKPEEEELVPFTGDWKFSGIESTAVDDIDFFKYYLFKIDDSHISIYKTDKTTLTTTLSYTREGNKVTFDPAFLDKYSSAKLRRSYGTGTVSICWDCGNNQVYNFDRL